METYRSKEIHSSTARLITAKEPCVVCKTPIKLNRVTHMVHVISGGTHILHPDDEGAYESDDGDLYFLPIGPTCAHKIGLEWVIKLEKH